MMHQMLEKMQDGKTTVCKKNQSIGVMFHNVKPGKLAELTWAKNEWKRLQKKYSN